MNKVIIFSHESDIDGLGSIVLAKLSFGDVDYVLLPNVEQLELTFRNYLETGKLDKYDKIYITDLALYDPALSIVDNSSIKNKVLIFDHHKRAIDDKMNRYDYTKIIECDEKGKRCGTELFFEYLVQHNLIKISPQIVEFVELTRLEDTWEWKNSGDIGILAHDLAILYSVIGKENYISAMISKLKKNELSFTLNIKEKEFIQNKKDEYNRKLQSIMETAEYFVDSENNKFGIVYANYEYRNELAEYIINNGNKENIKYFIIVAMDKCEYGQKSYRSIVSTFDVNNIAMLHGGGGHPGAASVNITKEQKSKALKLKKREALEYLANSNYHVD